MIIAVDTRERKPYFLSPGLDCPKVITCRTTLKTGDYSIVGHFDQVTIERKSLSDFWVSITRGRDRFKREIQRMAEIPCRAVVVEATLDQALGTRVAGRKFGSEVVIGTVKSWNAKYGVPFLFLGDRATAEQFTLQYLTSFYNDTKKNHLKCRQDVENVNADRKDISYGRL